MFAGLPEAADLAFLVDPTHLTPSQDASARQPLRSSHSHEDVDWHCDVWTAPLGQGFKLDFGSRQGSVRHCHVWTAPLGQGIKFDFGSRQGSVMCPAC